MSEAEQARKMAIINRLSLPEIPGWRWGVKKFRDYFFGEAAALATREQRLKEGR